MIIIIVDKHLNIRHGDLKKEVVNYGVIQKIKIHLGGIVEDMVK